MHFIVTGGAGFIGSHVSDRLLNQGHHVTVVDDFSTGHLRNLPNHYKLQLVNKNITNCSAQDFDLPIDGLAHLAAGASVTQSWLAPEDSHYNNLSSVIKVIQLCHSLKVPRIVFASSAAVYGTDVGSPVAETQPCQPISPYGLQKWSAERYLQLFASKFGFSVFCLRLFNVYGPRQSANSEYTGVISKFTSNLMHDQPVTLYGDGCQTRDFVYVRDVSIAFSKALHAPLEAGQSVSCNIGTSKSVSIRHLLETLFELLPNSSSQCHHGPPRQGDILHSCADISQACQYLGFEPGYTINSGLKEFIESAFIQS
jgi:UDP-glucose 4-epimerase